MNNSKKAESDIINIITTEDMENMPLRSKM